MIVKRTHKKNGIVVLEEEYEISETDIKKTLNFKDKLNSISHSATNWAKSGFQTADSETFNARLETCKGCEFWDAAGMAGTGRCQKCGCSTQAKLRMSTEKCPIGKW
jgi:hypothetical protein